MEANEILNEELIEDVVDVVELPPTESNCVVEKIVIGVVGVLAVAGVTMLYKKHKNKTDDDNDCKKRRFTLIKNRDEEPVDELDSKKTEEE